MIGSTRSLRVFAYPAAADLRKGYDGLHGLVASELGRDVLSGDCFLFTNRTRTRAKVLMWDGTGLCIYMNRLEQRRFAKLWDDRKGTALDPRMSELALFLEGSRMVGRIELSPSEYRHAALASNGRL